MSKIEKSLKNSVDQLPHPSLKELLEKPIEKMQEQDFITYQPIKARAVFPSKSIAYAACSFIIILSAIACYFEFLAVDGIVDLDVNPSIEISLNKRNNILKIESLNSDSESIVSGESYKGKNIEAAVEIIISKMVEQGYITKDKNSLLVSVSGKKRNSETLKMILNAKLADTMSVHHIEGEIFIQDFVYDKDIYLKAKDKGISQGRFLAIQKIMENNPDFSQDKLMTFSIEEMSPFIQSMGSSDKDDDEDVLNENEQDDDSDDNNDSSHEEASKEDEDNDQKSYSDDDEDSHSEDEDKDTQEYEEIEKEDKVNGQTDDSQPSSKDDDNELTIENSKEESNDNSDKDTEDSEKEASDDSSSEKEEKENDEENEED